MRKTGIVFILLAVSISTWAKPRVLSVKQIINGGTWSVAQGMHKGKPLIIRFRSEFRGKVDISPYPRLIKIVWKYPTNASGMPDKSASRKMQVFEDRLAGVVEKDAYAVLVAVITNSGQRSWAFYTRSVNEFAKRLTRMPQEKKRYPIKLTTERDPKWNFLYNKILAGMRDK